MELVNVTLAPVTEAGRRDAGEILDVVADLADETRAEELVEVLHGPGKLYRRPPGDGLLRCLFGRDGEELDAAPEDSERVSTCSRAVSASGPLRM